jgi:hypothetical protein
MNRYECIVLIELFNFVMKTDADGRDHDQNDANGWDHDRAIVNEITDA